MSTIARSLVLALIAGAAAHAAAAALSESPDGLSVTPLTPPPGETPAQRDARMKWWRDARFGMFIHWGLYSVPAGVWKDRTDHGEWIMNTGHIPVEEYEKFKDKFNPVKFNADTIARTAKDAGMGYIVITSKHHDGFALFDSKVSDYDVMATPFKRDIMKELAAACQKQGVKMCWYHSIMDWHHPDYTPRRDWETRPTTGADFDRYVAYMKGQLKELLTNYGPIGLIWFDGQWEGTWNNDRGRDLDTFVRGLQPDIIINSRVGKGGGPWGLDDRGQMLGDYATPEQEIPEHVIRDVDWETCMTMNDHWGYCAADHNFKTTEDLIRKLADIASKGGNFLLNIGPTAEGEIPPESVKRLAEIGAWMKVNGDAIHGTQASPFDALPAWGRVTQKSIEGGKTRLYLHVFEWPKSGELVLGGILNEPAGGFLLADRSTGVLNASRRDDAIVIKLPAQAPDTIDSVIALDIKGKPDVTTPPVISADTDIFVDTLDVAIKTDRERTELRYSIDGSDPRPDSPLAAGPVKLTQTATVKARAFRDGKAVSPVAAQEFKKVPVRHAAKVPEYPAGLKYESFEGRIKSVKELAAMKPVSSGRCNGFDISKRNAQHDFAFRYTGFVRVPAAGVYRFSTASDDGSALWIGDTLVVDNDTPHSLLEKSGVVALEAGLHPIRVEYFENTGGFDLKVLWSGPGLKKQEIPAAALVSEPAR